jgi:Flp pilus assembly pilin Flp
MKRMDFTNRITGRNRQFGQGMTEYIIIVALVAVGAIGVYNLFGKTVRDQTSAMACGLAGNACATTQTAAATTDATNSKQKADAAQGLSNFGQNVGNQ